jgi:hypothetical protein
VTFEFRPKTILWDMGDIEPIYFVSAALYDIDTRSKVSETIHFDLSSRNLLVCFHSSQRVIRTYQTNNQIAFFGLICS